MDSSIATLQRHCPRTILKDHGNCRYTKLERLRLTCIFAKYVNSCLQNNSYDAGSRNQGKMFADYTMLNRGQ